MESKEILLAKAEALEQLLSSIEAGPGIGLISKEGVLLVIREKVSALRTRAADLPSVPDGWKLVPVEPSEEHLLSMAIRSDHGLGVPGHYDHPSYYAASGGVTHEKRLAGAIRDMRQLYEEAIGNGFFKIVAPPTPIASGWNVPALDEVSTFILGRPNFVCAPIAHRLVQLGHAIPTKAEAEQAYVLHWLLGLYSKHGDTYMDEAKKILNAAP